MKKLRLTSVLLLSASAALCQPYGQRETHTGAKMTSGERTFINSPGFLMGGYGSRTLPGLTAQYIHIEKTDVGGGYSGGPPDMRAAFSIFEAGNCGYGTGYLTNQLVGVSVIETNLGPNAEWYALAGAYEGACFFSTLGTGGNTITTVMYPFPYQSSFVSKPVIVEEPSNPGNFFIAGHFDTTMYVLKVNITGGVTWSGFYHCGAPGPANSFQPRDMIISGHTADLIIVGHVCPDPQYNRFSDGFFLSLDPSNGNVNNFRDYSSTPCNWLNSIETAYSTTGGAGYITGGYSEGNMNAGNAWMMKIDLTGQIIWSNVITGNNPSNGTEDIWGVVERKNSNNSHEYYGVAQITDLVSAAPAQISNATVFKLDDMGNAAAGGPNQYDYLGTVNSNLYPINLTCLDPPGGADIGLHIYVNKNDTIYYFIEGYFNGVTGCNESLTYLAGIETGPTEIQPWIGRFGSLSPCNDLSLVPPATTPLVVITCSANSVAGGSNAKPVGLRELSGENSLHVYPNPGNGLYTIEANSGKELTLYDLLGREIFKTKIEQGTSTINITDKQDGEYILKVADKTGIMTMAVIKR